MHHRVDPWLPGTHMGCLRRWDRGCRGCRRVEGCRVLQLRVRHRVCKGRMVLRHRVLQHTELRHRSGKGRSVMRHRVLQRRELRYRRGKWCWLLQHWVLQHGLLQHRGWERPVIYWSIVGRLAMLGRRYGAGGGHG